MGEKSIKIYGRTPNAKSDGETNNCFFHHDFNQFNNRGGSKDTIDNNKAYSLHPMRMPTFRKEGKDIDKEILPSIQGGERVIHQRENRNTNILGVKEEFDTKYATG